MNECSIPNLVCKLDNIALYIIISDPLFHWLLNSVVDHLVQIPMLYLAHLVPFSLDILSLIVPSELIASSCAKTFSNAVSIPAISENARIDEWITIELKWIHIRFLLNMILIIDGQLRILLLNWKDSLPKANGLLTIYQSIMAWLKHLTVTYP